MKSSEKKALRARWTTEQLFELNEVMIRSTPKQPAWSIDRLKSAYSSHEACGRSFVDLRGFTFWALRNIDWEYVDFSGSLFRSGLLAPRLVGTGSLGNISLHLKHCLFNAIEANDSNMAGKFEDCIFDLAKLRKMNFSHRTNLLRCSFRDADLRQWQASRDVCFIECDFTNAKMHRCDFSNVIFERCDFKGVNLNEAALMGVKFVNCSMAGVSGESVILEKNIFEGTESPPFVPLMRRK